ncbi:hypothetical protein XELAEV_18013351mg [Xenopus laevis]|uniref:Uncharacterized protein n=1 Tax=Xenopus laevis TaxID=8355 RepID=A0A974DPF0_XENLA|nr:hypothetical protein XELAEV_18013351mg [Xenopus laevis]
MAHTIKCGHIKEGFIKLYQNLIGCRTETKHTFLGLLLCYINHGRCPFFPSYQKATVLCGSIEKSETMLTI